MQDPETLTPDLDRRATSDVNMAMIFLSQTVVGVLGNSSLLYYYLFLYFTQSRLKSTDFVIMHLTAANILTLLCKGVPQTMASFGWKDFLNDFGCKGLFYLHRVGRSASISSTSFLSVYQVITMNSTDSKWAVVKFKYSKYFVSWINLSWSLNLLINIVCLINISSKQGNKNMTNLKDFGYCSSVNPVKTQKILNVVYLSFPDVICLWIMLWSNGSMVLILHRHKKRMQQLIRSQVSPQSSPETRASQTILSLVSTFVCFYLLSCICHVCLVFAHNPSWFLVNISAIISSSFPTLSPFLLIRYNSSVLTFYFTCIRNKNVP